MKNHIKFSCRFPGKSLIIMSGLMIFFLSNGFAQNAGAAKFSSETKIKSPAWQSLINNDLIEINYRYAECNLSNAGTDNENVYLQIKNKTDKELKSEWNTEYWYNGKCIGCEAGNSENHRTIILKPNETIEGSCTEQYDQSLMIFSKMLNFDSKSELTNFNLRDLKITSTTK